MSKSYQDLVAWQKEIDLVADVYRFTSRFPKEGTYGLTSQLQRAAISVPVTSLKGKVVTAMASSNTSCACHWDR